MSASTELRFDHRHWLVPSEQNALAGWLEGSPTAAERAAAKSQASKARETWQPPPEAWQQLVAVHQFIGRHVRIQFWDDGTMWLLGPEEWPRRVLGLCDAAIVLRVAKHVQAYLRLRHTREDNVGGCSGLSFLTEDASFAGSLAPLASIYHVEAVPPPKQGSRSRP